MVLNVKASSNLPYLGATSTTSTRSVLRLRLQSMSGNPRNLFTTVYSTRPPLCGVNHPSVQKAPHVTGSPQTRASLSGPDSLYALFLSAPSRCCIERPIIFALYR
eukprot:3062997-Rhodomonas_salina.2